MTGRGPPRGGGRGRGPPGGGKQQGGQFQGGGRGHGGGGDQGGERGQGGGRGRGQGRGNKSPPKAYSPKEGVPTPNPKVTSVEDDTIKASKASKGQLPDLSELSLEQRLPRRPGHGTQGTKTTLFANYFQILPKPELELHRYDIAMTPEAVGKKRQRVVEQFLAEGQIALARKNVATDFKSTLVCDRELPPDFMRAQIVYKQEGEDDPLPKAQTYTVSLSKNGRFTVAELIAYLTSTNISAAFGAKADIIQALNIVLGFEAKKTPNSSILSVGANKHYSMAAGPCPHTFDLGVGLRAWRGYFTSVRAATSRLLLNVQIKHVATYRDGSLLELMKEHKLAHNDGKMPLYLQRLEKFLQKLRIQTHHLPPKKNKKGEIIPRVKTIFGLAHHKLDGHGTPKLPKPPIISEFGAGPGFVKFWLEDGGPSSAKKPTPGKQGPKGGSQPKGSGNAVEGGQYITVQDFFKKTYGENVAARVPVLNVGTRQNPMYLPADVCTVMPGQPARSQLSPIQTANMIKFAVRMPYDNAESIVREGPLTLGLNGRNPLLGQYGIEVGQSLITVPARVLPTPRVRYAGTAAIDPKFGSWNMTRIKFTKGADFPAWTVLTFELPRTPSGKDERFIQSEHELKSRIDDFATVGLTSNGIKPGQLLWPPHAPIAVNDSNIDGPLHQGFKHILGLTRKPQVVLIILSRRSIPLYNRIKYLGDVVYGIHTVCVLCHKFFEVKGKDQYSANVGLKFNLKLGGMNQTLDDAKLGIVGQNKTMIVGLDVTHPSPGSSESAPSVAGMVANLDNKLAQWPGILRVQEARKEMVSDLGEMFQTRLQLWRGKHEQWLPENIIIYRDGVSEGQYQTVMEEEMPQFRETCRKLYSADMTKKGFPRMTCIIVGKRHHTRFYPTSAEEGKIDTNSSNPKNGTVVDRGVTEVRNWDFFLQSHTALKGTARPAHYFVLHDEIFTAEKPKAPFVNAADVLEDLTHNMSYLWGRATKAVSLCPPAYYADKLCERARCYLSHLFDGSPDPSTAGSTAGGSASDAERQRLLTAQRTSTTVHANLRDQMFYI